MNSRFLGGILLIIGTSLGGGMLALPIATASGGFTHALCLLVATWLLTVISAFYILEVNLSLPSGTNMVSMAKARLGVIGQAITWACYLLLLYSLLAAYTAGGSDLMGLLFAALHIQAPVWLQATLFVLLLGVILFHGIKSVDWFNRGFMSFKFLVYLLLVIAILPHVKIPLLLVGKWRYLSPAILVAVTSFGYGTIIPSLRTYFHDDVRKLRLMIALGSLIPLICYLLWDFSVQGTLPLQGPHGLVPMAHSRDSVANLTQALSTELHSQVISNLAHTFTYVCILTSFLGVALGLTDFLSDGLHIPKRGLGRWPITFLALAPPLFIVLCNPGIFLIGLNYAGLACVILLLLLPALMVLRQRYVQRVNSPFKTIGGVWLIVIEILASLALLVYGIYHLFHV